MKKQSKSISRRQVLALTGCVGMASLLPSRAMAEETVSDTPPDPGAMLTNMPESDNGSEQGKLRASGPSWGTSSQGGSLKSFYDGSGNLFLDPACKVIDVSEHNGKIDWNAVKNAGVDAAIIRLGYGYSFNPLDSQVDDQLANNINACNNLGIPYGLYLYSYAFDSNFATQEATFTANVIEKYGCKPSLPIFYDLEEWTWTGHKPPTTVSAYEKIVRAYCDTLANRGYTNVKVYSYRAYLYGPLNSEYIWRKAAWAAEYNPTLKFNNPYYKGCQAWQYTDTGSTSGVSGNVDMNAFPPLYKLKFSDVYLDTPHCEDIWWLAQTGISTGFADGSFGCMRSVVRQDMAAFLYRLVGSPSYTPSNEDKKRFPDVTSSTPHCDEIWWLGSTGIAEGFEDGSFRGLNPVARQDMAAFLYRIIVRYIDSSYENWQPSSQDKQRFSDVTDSTPHAKEIYWMGATGLSTGFSDGTFKGLNAVARQDMAAFLHRAYTLKGQTIRD